MNRLSTNSLAIGYTKGSQKLILQDKLDLSLNKGEMISIIGQNGVGKSTFIKTLIGLLPSLAGEVSLDDRNLKKLPSEEVAKKIGVVLTDRSFATNLTVMELVAAGRHPYSNWLGILSARDREIIEWAISETQINYLVQKKLGELSDGQLQKALIARVLAQDTDIMILDEPAAHLDLNNRIEMFKLLRKFADQGKSILISTHEIQITSQLSDKLWLFNFNEPVIEGNPDELIKNGSVHHVLNLAVEDFDLRSGRLH